MNRIGDNLVCHALNKDIVKAFRDFGVEFILVGGLAVSWYCASRQADDMDILVNPTPENSKRVANALEDLGRSGFASDSFASLGVQAPVKKHYYADIMTPARNGLTFEDFMKDAIVGKLFGIPVHIPSARNLIKLKERVRCFSRERFKQASTGYSAFEKPCRITTRFLYPPNDGFGVGSCLL